MSFPNSRFPKLPLGNCRDRGAPLVYTVGMDVSFKMRVAAMALLLFSFPAFSLAQVDDERVSLDLSPENPKPNSLVTATLVSHIVDIKSSSISWSYGGKTIASGVGKTKVSFAVGAAGERKTLFIRIQTRGGETIDKSVVIAPAAVSLAWEATDSYIPPFYRGKALLSSQGRVRVVALPDIRSGGAAVKSSSLQFTWKRDGKTNLAASGVGRDTFSLKAGYTGSETVSVEVATLDGSVRASGSLEVPIGKPKIVFYEDKPLGGVNYEVAVPASIRLFNEEITVVGEPYFISSGSGSVSHSWSLNGARISGSPDNPAKVTLRVPAGQEGSSEVALTAKHAANLLQEARAAFTISFDQGQ